MKRFCGVLLALLLCASCACAELTFACYGDDTVASACAKAASDYGVAYPKTKALWTSRAYPTREAYRQAFLADAPGFADVMLLDAQLLAEAYPSVLDVEPYLNLFDLNNYSYRELCSVVVDGVIRAWPVTVSGRLFYWNSGLLKHRGVKAPDAWDVLPEAAAVLEEDEWLLCADSTGRVTLVVAYLQGKYGRDWLDPQTGRCAFTQDEIAEGMEWLLSLEKVRVLAPMDTQGDDALAAWATGRYAGVYLWNTDFAAVQAALPEGGKLQTIASLRSTLPFDGSMVRVDAALAVPSGCKDPEAAARFANYLLNEELGVRFMTVFGVPASESGCAFAKRRRLLDIDALEACQLAMSEGAYIQPLTFERPSLTQDVYPACIRLLDGGDAPGAAKLLLEGTNAR